MLLGVCFSWILLISLPGLDSISPVLQVVEDGYSIPITELLVFLLVLVVSFYQLELFKSCVGENISRVQERTVTCLAAATACGSGQHFICVTLQTQLLESDKIYSFVEFLHKIWSHQVLFGGWYALVLYTTWSEGSYILRLQDKKEERQQAAHPIITFFTAWVLPVLMGVFFNRVTPPTHTQYLLAMFNVAIGTVTCLLYMIQPSSLQRFISKLLPKMTVLVFFVKCVIVNVLFHFVT